MIFHPRYFKDNNTYLRLKINVLGKYVIVAFEYLFIAFLTKLIIIWIFKSEIFKHQVFAVEKKPEIECGY